MQQYAIYSLQLHNDKLNSELLTGFRYWQNSPDIKRTHLFNGRYENIYLDASHIPALAELVQTCTNLAQDYLHIEALKAGYWFNAMPPGAVTTRHSHDDDDELLSAAYYVHVPPDSGDLILYDAEPPSRITPIAGQLILFPPDIDHEVTRNNSTEDRLSIGMNFGPLHED
jgi:hypothetical protein